MIKRLKPRWKINQENLKLLFPLLIRMKMAKWLLKLLVLLLLMGQLTKTRSKLISNQLKIPLKNKLLKFQLGLLEKRNQFKKRKLKLFLLYLLRLSEIMIKRRKPRWKLIKMDSKLRFQSLIKMKMAKWLLKLLVLLSLMDQSIRTRSKLTSNQLKIPLKNKLLKFQLNLLVKRNQ